MTFSRTAFAKQGAPSPGLEGQCELLHITRSTLYYEPKQPDAAALLLKEEIMAHIDFWHTQLPCIGTRKLAVKLCQEGYHVGRKLVRSCMQEMGIHAVYRKAKKFC